MVGISFDRKSLIINGGRRFILSGAMHYYRLPGVEMWRRCLRQIRELGLNTVDIYFYWGYHSPAPGVYDFNGVRDVERLLDLIEEEGLWLMARPGPYICSEVDGGGFPGWLLARRGLKLRCRENGKFVYDPEYMKYVREWYEQIVPRIARRPNLILFQIENEYHLLPTPRGALLAFLKILQRRFGPNVLFNLQMLKPVKTLLVSLQRRAMRSPAYRNENQYMKTLYDWARELGIKVPIFHNDIEGAMTRFVDVDIVGIDDYPIKTFDVDWRGRDHVFRTLDLLEEGHAAHGKACPLLIGETQGGWFDNWGGKGYPFIRRRLGPHALDITLKTILSQGASIISVFMTAGGTSWGYTASPDVYTSLDYGAPITEGGMISARGRALQQFAEFVHRWEKELLEAIPAPPPCEYHPELFCRARRAPSGRRFVFFRNCTPEAQAVKLGDTRLVISPDQMLTVVEEEGKIIDHCEPPAKIHDPAPPTASLPRLEHWTFGMVSQPLAPDYDDSNWRLVRPGEPLDLDSLGYHYGFVWYRARLRERLSRFRLDARHCWAAYLNGRLIQAFDNHKNRLAAGDDMAETVDVRIPAEYYRSGENVLVLLVESLGHNKGFLEDLHNPRGIASIHTGRLSPEWRVRGGLLPGESGITPRLDFSQVPVENQTGIILPHQWPAELEGVGLYQTTFELRGAQPDNPALGLYLFTAVEKANIYLNGWLIGRAWDSVGPQKVFYLPSGLLNLNGVNHIALALWRWREPARLSKIHLTMYS